MVRSHVVDSMFGRPAGASDVHRFRRRDVVRRQQKRARRRLTLEKPQARRGEAWRLVVFIAGWSSRSEERRVGKECLL